MERSLLVHNGSTPKPPDHIRFVCVSDTHSRPYRPPEGDVLIHAGDFTKRGAQEEVFQLANQLRGLSHKYKVLISGNHDSPFDVKNYEKIIQKHRNPVKEDPFVVKRLLKDFIYLEDSFCQIAGYSIWGTPWTQEHYKGAFTLRDKDLLASKWLQIPQGVNILVSHSPPFGILDMSKDGKHVGCKSLAEAVQRIRPLVHVFGHIHEGHGFTTVEGVTYINASICNNRYQPIYEPFVFDLPAIEEF
jgi:Icc-related predicted phosphoesterase